MDVVINIDASIDRLRTSLRDAREEARRTKQAIESDPIRITATGRGGLGGGGLGGGGGYVGAGATSFSGAAGGFPLITASGARAGLGGGGGYVGLRPGVGGGGSQQLGGSASEIAAEAAAFGIAAEDRRRFAATARPGSIAAASGGGLSAGGILNTAVRGALVVQGIRGAVAFGRGLSRLRSGNLDDNLAGIDDIGSVPLLGDVAREISETVTGTSTRQIREGLAASEAGLNRFRQITVERQRTEASARFEARRAEAGNLQGAARQRAEAEIERDVTFADIDSRLANKSISAETASRIKRAATAKLQSVLVSLEDAAFDASAAVADEIAASEAGADGNRRAAGRVELAAGLERRLREARRNNPELVPVIEKANAAALANFDKQNTAEAGLAAGGRADRVAAAEVSASVAVLRAKGENLRAEREEFERTSELKIAAAEREAEALKDIDRERSEAAKAEAKALRIEAGGQRAAFEIAVQRQTADANAEARFIRIGTNQGQLSEQIARIGRDTTEAIRGAAGSPELAKARGEVGIAQLERIARQLDEAVAGTQASVSTRGSFLSAQVGGLNDPNRETVATLKNDIAGLLREIAQNTKAGGAGAVAQ